MSRTHSNLYRVVLLFKIKFYQLGGRGRRISRWRASLAISQVQGQPGLQNTHLKKLKQANTEVSHILLLMGSWEIFRRSTFMQWVADSDSKFKSDSKPIVFLLGMVSLVTHSRVQQGLGHPHWLTVPCLIMCLMVLLQTPWCQPIPALSLEHLVVVVVVVH